MNPTIPEAVIDRAMELDPQRPQSGMVCDLQKRRGRAS